MTTPEVSDEVKQRRATRIAQIKEAFLVGLRQHHVFGPEYKVEIADEALINMFSFGILDAPEGEFGEFLESLRTVGPPEPVGEGEDSG